MRHLIHVDLPFFLLDCYLLITGVIAVCQGFFFLIFFFFRVVRFILFCAIARDSNIFLFPYTNVPYQNAMASSSMPSHVVVIAILHVPPQYVALKLSFNQRIMDHFGMDRIVQLSG